VKPGATTGVHILSDAGPVTSGGQAGAVATTGAANKTYTLIVKPGEDLSKHVNHKIEVMGTISAVSSTASKPSSSPQSGTTAQSGTSQSGATAQGSATAKPSTSTPPSENFNVQSFKMVSAACP
jgi:hypothetical protein